TTDTNYYDNFASNVHIPYSITLTCSDVVSGANSVGAPIALLLDGTNVPNGGILTFAPTTNDPVPLNLTITNLGVTNLSIPKNAGFGAANDATNPFVSGDFEAYINPGPSVVD